MCEPKIYNGRKSFVTTGQYSKKLKEVRIGVVRNEIPLGKQGNKL